MRIKMDRSCNYSTLGRYSSGLQGLNIVAVPENFTNPVPSFGSPAYNSLSGQPGNNCSGFANIMHAYSKGENNCNQQYVRRLCQN